MIKTKLSQNRLHHALFDTKLFQILKHVPPAMYGGHQGWLAPDHIVVPAILIFGHLEKAQMRAQLTRIDLLPSLTL